MTNSLTHALRLARWGRILARHGALLGIERDPIAPAPLRRLARLARFGLRMPDRPRYADAFQAIGPAAIKLGQALATRPDLVGEAAAHDLSRLQDAVPPIPFAAVEAQLEHSLERPIAQAFATFDSHPVGAASIAQVYRATTPDGRAVAVKVLRPGIEEEMTRAIATFQWAAIRAERMGGELRRLRPRLVIAHFRQWTLRELDLRREAASASELAEQMEAEPRFRVPAVDWSRTTRRVLTIDWVDGIKLSQRQALAAAGHDLPALAATLVRAFLRQAIANGFFHADLHQGNLFARADGTVAAIDFGIMGRLSHQARLWLAEILHGLITGNYLRVAEIHFEAQYVPAHHNVAEFATALRAVGEPIRGLPVKDVSIGQMLDGLFAITRDFDMETQPHLLLLQKTMVMVEGVASSLDPDINMWEVAGPLVGEWLRDELGPEAYLADLLRENLRTLARLPDLVRRIEDRFPAPGGAPPAPPLADPPPRRRPSPATAALLAALAGLVAGWLLH